MRLEKAGRNPQPLAMAKAMPASRNLPMAWQVRAVRRAVYQPAVHVREQENGFGRLRLLIVHRSTDGQRVGLLRFRCPPLPVVA